VYGTKAFYEAFFMKMAKLDWARVEAAAEKWKPFLDDKYPQYVEEMQGGSKPKLGADIRPGGRDRPPPRDDHRAQRPH
jgi:Mn-dependent DtxR family transcriptional regulator